MNKFTPGPWVADGRDISPESNQELSICAVMPIDLGGEKGWHDGKETEANARLIAAAPDLLESLEELSKAYSDALRDEFNITECPLIDKALATIASARGDV